MSSARPTDANHEAFKAFISDLSEQNDRAAVILGGARIDIGLRHVLVHALAPSTSSKDELLDNDAPLSTFHSRIQICLRLGLITAEFAQALQLLRRIRNDFAHETTGASLTSGPHYDRIRELSRPFIRVPAYLRFRDRYFAEFSGARREFRAAVSVLAARLDGVDDYVPSITCQVPITTMPPHWLEPELTAAASSEAAANDSGREEGSAT